jgi:proline iminopeptidase
LHGYLADMIAPVKRRTRRNFLFAVIVIIAAIGLWQYLTRWGSTPPFRDSRGQIIAGSIAEMQRVKLDGVEQSIIIRGRDAKAPILIWLHGGPGSDEVGLWRKYNADLENRFVVIYWTQRGTGRSYSNDIPAASMTIDRFVEDLNQLIFYAQRRFGKQRVVLAGHSWGTSFGVAYVLKHPQNVAAYVGVGQVVNATAGERRSYRFALAEAKRLGDAEAVRELTALGNPPYPLSSIMTQRGWLEKFGGGTFHRPISIFSLMRQSFEASEVTSLDGLYFKAGVDFSLNALARENATVDWWSNARRLDVPVFIATGRFDRNTDAYLQKAWFDRLNAPMKSHRWFEHSAHSPLFEEASAFNKFMIDDILPVAEKRRFMGN